MTETHLRAGYDVLIPNVMRFWPVIERFEVIARNHEADFCELLLSVSKKDAIERFMARGGFRPSGILAQGGIPYLEQMYDEIIETSIARQDTVKITTKYGDLEGTYLCMINALR